MIRVVLADSHPIVLSGLEFLLHQHSDIRVVGSATRVDECVSLLREHRPDVVILDSRLGPDPAADGGMAVLAAVDSMRPRLRFVLLGDHFEHHQTILAMQRGVCGMLMKGMATEMIVRCVRKVAEGGRWLERESQSELIEHLLRRADSGGRHPSGLSARELEVGRLVAEGLRNREIAERLSIKEGTVKLHLHKVFKKLNITSRAQLASQADRLELR